ncbi:hypothetical protein BDZ91DRAFT_750677, partial [Kalaharituber pfeilii]
MTCYTCKFSSFYHISRRRVGPAVPLKFDSFCHISHGPAVPLKFVSFCHISHGPAIPLKIGSFCHISYCRIGAVEPVKFSSCPPLLLHFCCTGCIFHISARAY